LKCPRCSDEQLCPCDRCVTRNAGKVTWRHMDDATIACGHCGFSMAATDWRLLSAEQADEMTALHLSRTLSPHMVNEVFASRREFEAGRVR